MDFFQVFITLPKNCTIIYYMDFFQVFINFAKELHYNLLYGFLSGFH